MPYTTLVSGTTITASWANTNIRDQVVTPFATTAARDSAITTPVVGMLCYITGTGQLLEYQSATTGWTPPWNTAWGRIGSTSFGASDQTGITTAANLTGSGVTATVVANRRIRLTASVPLFQLTSAGQVVVYFYRGSAIGWAADLALQVSDRHRVNGVMEDFPAAGAHTWLLQATTSAATLTIENSRNSGYLIVEDMGPTIAPA